MNLKRYTHRFENLKVDKAHGIAPHKPVLLLSIIQLIENGSIDSNRIYITPELVSAFKSHWHLLVTSKHTAIFALPFYHLTSDKFWRLIAKPGYEKALELKGAMRSFNNLNAAVDYAEIDNTLYDLLKIKESRDILRWIILDKYFPENREGISGGNFGNNYLKELGDEVLKESSEEYRNKLDELKHHLSNENYEEELFLRGSAFKREVLKVYNNTCCISGLRIDATISVSMIDACHIVPFTISHDDTIGNGFALCPNLHRAFDRGLIWVDGNYRVIVARNFIESSQSPYQIKIFNEKRLILPDNQKYFPSLENLGRHKTLMRIKQ